MTETKKPSGIFFSLIVPAHADRGVFEGHVSNVCSVLDNQIPGYYEIVAVESGEDNPSNDWDHVKGEVLVIIDGDLACSPTTLCEVITSFHDGSDMAFAGQYRDGKKTDTDPELSYFGIRRSSLSRIHESPDGHRLILEILGPETIKKLSTSPRDISGNYILKHLRKMIGVRS
jgi:hypothetical protein